MKIHLLEKRTAQGYTTFGSCWQKGEFFFDQKVAQITGSNGIIPSQTRVTAYWPDGSVKWAAHTADASQLGQEAELDLVANGAADFSGNEIETQAGQKVIKGEKLAITLADANDSVLVKSIELNGKFVCENLRPALQLTNADETLLRDFNAVIEAVVIETEGPVESVVKFTGHHQLGSESKMPFTIRLFAGYQADSISFQHTFFYDGEEEQDFLKGYGLKYDIPVVSNLYDRHVKFTTDRNVFHETAITLASWKPKIEPEVLADQLAEKFVDLSDNEAVQEAIKDLPIWDHYRLFQDSAQHFSVTKKTAGDHCYLKSLDGRRTLGGAAFGDDQVGVAATIKNFWQKYPAGVGFDQIQSDRVQGEIWFYSPQAESFDFRHYDSRSYPYTSYEGFPDVRATAYGIAVTSEASLKFTDKLITNEELTNFAQSVAFPPVYVAAPEYYHEKGAFGRWSLVKRDTEVENWLEDQLVAIFDFYHQEVDARSWYGLFDFGDVMHTYDRIRHNWKYDNGGFAWDNTELLPTYWLWLYFLRTGRGDVFTMAENMTRHTSEVDFYHFGEIKGIGTRHNVRHWGCSCKEPRVSMAGHHRFLYYLTGDRRLEDVFEDVKDADTVMADVEVFMRPERQKADPLVIRSGPDWTTFVSNWFTEYERTQDEKYRKRIEFGIEDIASTPLGLASGPDYQYDIETGHLTYFTEDENTPNMHLQVCMGGPETFFEVIDSFEQTTLSKLLVDYGRFYYLPIEQKRIESNGLIQNRNFAFPYFATPLGAYSAMMNKDGAFAKEVWAKLLYALASENDKTGFSPEVYTTDWQGREYLEIPFVTTNFVSQFSKNSIIALDMIREYLPKTMAEMDQLLINEANNEGIHKRA